MVTWIKQVAAGDTGTSTKVGSDQWNIMDKYHGGVDVSASLANPTNIATPTEWESGVLSIGNSSNANKITITSSAQTGNFNLNIPVLTANTDLSVGIAGAAMLANANVFTPNIQTINSNNQRILKLYRPASTANNTVGIEFDHMNASSVQTSFAQILAKLITNTAGVEDGAMQIAITRAGSSTNVINIDKNGTITQGVNQNQILSSVLLSSGASTTVSNTVSETDLLNYTLKGNTLNANGCLKVRISGYILQNDSTSRAFQVKVKFGTTTIFDSTTQSMAQDSENRPFYMDFTLRNANATNAQVGTGKFSCSLADVTAATGLGDINDDEIQVDSVFGMGTSAKDTTADQVLQITMTHALASTAVQTVVTGKLIEFLPGFPTA